jgi:hypothetical protein
MFSQYNNNMIILKAYNEKKGREQSESQNLRDKVTG